MNTGCFTCLGERILKKPTARSGGSTWIAIECPKCKGSGLEPFPGAEKEGDKK